MASDTWDYLPSMSNARYGHVCGLVKGQESQDVFVAGGKDREHHIFDSVEAFSLEAREWRQSERLPERIFRSESHQFGNSFVVFGGIGIDGENVDGFYQFDEINSGWAQREERLARRRSSHIAFEIQGKSKISVIHV